VSKDLNFWKFALFQFGGGIVPRLKASKATNALHLWQAARNRWLRFNAFPTGEIKEIKINRVYADFCPTPTPSKTEQW
jgi:hypothetical protein